jgi:hypothetical protein
LRSAEAPGRGGSDVIGSTASEILATLCPALDPHTWPPKEAVIDRAALSSRSRTVRPWPARGRRACPRPAAPA